MILLRNPPPRDALLTDLTFGAIDIETTGLTDRDGIVELGALLFRLDSSETRSYSSLVNPGIPINPQAQKVHGITDSMLAGRPSPREAMPHFQAFIGDADVLLAHNAPFDKRYLVAAGATLSCLLDTLPLARARAARPLKKFGLDDLVHHFQIRTDDAPAHRGAGDTLRLARVFYRLVNGLPKITRLWHLRDSAGGWVQ